MPGPVFMANEDIELRTIEREDLEFAQQALNDPAVRRGLGTSDPLTMADEESFYENVVVESDDIHLLVCSADGPAGICGLNNLDATHGTAKLGYWIASEHHGNGYATAAARLLVDYGFREQRLHKVYADTFAFNEASQRVLEKVGFEREGVHRDQGFVDGEHVDVYRHGLLRDDFER